jgi:hypothetical protein
MVDPKSKSIRSSLNSAFNRKKYSEIEKKEEKDERDEKESKKTATKEKRMFDAEIT